MPVTQPAAATRAWVESPLQMVSALEASAAGALGDAVEVVYRAGIPSLVELAARLGTVALPESTCVTAWDARGLWRRGYPEAFGDAFSGAVQARGALARRRPVVVLDDGLATLHLLDLLTSPTGGPLVRARAHPGPPRRALALAARARLLRLAREGGLTVFTALPVREPVARAFAGLGGRLVRNSFAWSASLRAPELHGAQVVVVGSAMASDGLVHAGSYARWVHSIADSDAGGGTRDDAGEVVYLPHRREDPAITAMVADRPSIRVERGPWPVEVSLRCLPAGAVVHCLPSTPLLTLRTALADLGVVLEGSPVPDDWWTPAASARFRAGVAAISGPPA